MNPTDAARRVLTWTRPADLLIWGRGSRWLLWALPAVFAAVYAIAVLADFNSVINSINVDSDAIVGPVLAKLLDAAPPGRVAVLGNHPWYEELLFLRATSGLPFYRQLWEVSPMLWSLTGLAILGWAARRALGGWAALVTVSALVCLGAFGRFVFLTFIWHAATVFQTILIGAALVWLASRPQTGPVLSWPRVVALAVALGLVSALAVGSDQLFLFWALIPMLVTATLVAWRGAGAQRTRFPAFAAIVTLVALPGGALFAHVMRSAGYVATPFKLDFAAPGALLQNFVLMIEGYTGLAGGDFLGVHTGLPGYAVFASGMLVCAALVLVLVEVRRTVASAPPRPPQGDPYLGPRFAYIAFWSASLVVTTAVFVLSSVPVDALSARYMLSGYVAIGALLPLLALRGPGWRVLVTTGLCVFSLSATYQLVRQPFQPGNNFPTQADANALLRFAREQGVSYGYAGYWDAANLTWATRFGVRLYPVQPCGANLCVFHTVQISTWYAPHPGTSSLLVIDPNKPGVQNLPPALGPPRATRQFGALTAAVFPYDVESRLGP